ncbi:MAG: hypothetical protein PWP65_82 [Clostridia bacterium]|nr:hypothetical protein [Clostridia bacterium]
MPEVPLRGLRVLELGSTVAAAYCARLLAGFGAGVTRLELPGQSGPGDYAPVVQKALSAYLNAGKESVALDLNAPSGRKLFGELLAGADVLIEDLPFELAEKWGINIHSLEPVNPQLILTSISPFGRSGPYRAYKANELVVFHMSGLGYMTPREIGGRSGREKWEPLKGPGQIAYFYAGLSAAGATMCALLARERIKKGQHVDIAILECLLPLLRRELAVYLYQGIIPSRFTRSRGIAPLGIRRCRDGYVFVQIMEERQWQGFVEMMDNPEWAKDERFKDQESRYRNCEALDPLVNAWLSQHSKEEICREAQKRKVPFAAVNSLEDLFTFPQLVEHQYFLPVSTEDGRSFPAPGCPAKFSTFRWGEGR